MSSSSFPELEIDSRISGLSDLHLSKILTSGKLEEDKEKLLVEVITQLKGNFKS